MSDYLIFELSSPVHRISIPDGESPSYWRSLVYLYSREVDDYNTHDNI